jgi:predicted nucleic acid-binding protein
VSAPPVYIDTNVFIIGFESAVEIAKPVQDLLIALRQQPRSAVTSEITLAELLAPVLNPKALDPNQRRRLYVDLLIWSNLIELKPVTRDILMDTADLRQGAPYKLPDAIHVMTAVHAKCGFFLSNDKRMRLPAGMIAMSPDSSSVGRILAAWSL